MDANTYRKGTRTKNVSVPAANRSQRLPSRPAIHPAEASIVTDHKKQPISGTRYLYTVLVTFKTRLRLGCEGVCIADRHFTCPYICPEVRLVHFKDSTVTSLQGQLGEYVVVPPLGTRLVVEEDGGATGQLARLINCLEHVYVKMEVIVLRLQSA